MKRKKIFKRTAFLNFLTNFTLGILILSIGILCFAPMEDGVKTDGEKTELYRSASANSGCISLMFNVYWGTDEVYDILAILKNYEAKATFFVGGCWADDNVECLRAIYADGHEIGNHGYFHKDHEKLSVEQNIKEISDCNRFIDLAIGSQPTLFAPPSGAYGTDTLSACKQLQMKTILWSKDTIDWRDKDVSVIYRRATKNVVAGDFILMHPMKATVDALEDILKYYKSKSLNAVTVSEHLQKDG